MSSIGFRFLVVLVLAVVPLHAAPPHDLEIGTSGHAFDHLGNIDEQADAAAASGATIIYATGVGGFGYLGLPDEAAQKQHLANSSNYTQAARGKGIRLVLGYVCATSIVKLDQFDRNWSAEFRKQFRTLPPDWRQQDVNGKPLPSWYGGDYQPACMNNPDWRSYERQIVRLQLESGCDGIFFDNPTVHPQGCYCPHCMKLFAQFLEGALHTNFVDHSAASLRKLAAANSREFMLFRAIIAREFLADIRNFARTLKKNALITANNSLNSREVLYSQCRTYGYSIYEMSKAEDFVVVEDMSGQPRVLKGNAIEYGPTYRQLLAISHGKPVVAVCIADADYHTPPNLVRLAMAEAAANSSSHLWWPTWPEPERARMVAAIAPEALFLRNNSRLLNGTDIRHDAVLFLPMRDFVERGDCPASSVAAELSRANVQFSVICEGQFAEPAELKRTLRDAQVLLVPAGARLLPKESRAVETFRKSGGFLLAAEGGAWMQTLRDHIKRPSLELTGSEFVRGVVHDQGSRTIVHLLNLNIEKLTSFTDRVQPSEKLRLRVRSVTKSPHSVKALTADATGTKGQMDFQTSGYGTDTYIDLLVPRVEIASLIVIE